MRSDQIIAILQLSQPWCKQPASRLSSRGRNNPINLQYVSILWITVEGAVFKIRLCRKERQQERWQEYRPFFWVTASTKTMNTTMRALLLPSLNLLHYWDPADHNKEHEKISCYCRSSESVNGFPCSLGHNVHMNTLNTYCLVLSMSIVFCKFCRRYRCFAAGTLTGWQ